MGRNPMRFKKIARIVAVTAAGFMVAVSLAACSSSDLADFDKFVTTASHFYNLAETIRQNTPGCGMRQLAYCIR
jgi:hypothetical protein